MIVKDADSISSCFSFEIMAAFNNFDSCSGCLVRLDEFGRDCFALSDLIDFLHRHGVVNKQCKCSKCGETLNYKLVRGKPYFRCQKLSVVNGTKTKCNFTQSVYKGTFFQNIHLTVYKMCKFVWFFVVL
jgi:hypothetical protein